MRFGDCLLDYLQARAEACRRSQRGDI